MAGALGAVRVTSRRTRRASRRAPVRRTHVGFGIRVRTPAPRPKPRPKARPNRRRPTYDVPVGFGLKARLKGRDARRVRRLRKRQYEFLRREEGKAARNFRIRATSHLPTERARRRARARLRTRIPRKQAARAEVALQSSYQRRNRVRPMSPQFRDRKVAGFNVSNALGTAGKKLGESPAIQLLAQTSRPVHAVAGATLAVQRGKSPVRAAIRAFNRDPQKGGPLFSDVLKEAGVDNKYVRAIGGFGLDVAADPTTYLTLGAAVPAKAAAKKLPKGAIRREVRRGKSKGLSEADAIRAAPLAARLRRAKPNRGIQVGLRIGGREVKTSGRATAALSRAVAVPGAARSVREHKATQIAGQLFHPGFRPKGVGDRAWRRYREAERTARATTMQGQRDAQSRAVAYFRALKAADQRQVIRAVETGNYRGLTKREAEVAQVIRRDLDSVHEAERALRLVGEPLPNYFPHKLKAKLAPGGGKSLTRGKRAQLESSKRRGKRQTLVELEREGYAEFSQDVSLVVGARLSQSAAARGNAHLISELAGTGHRNLGKLADDESVYRITARNLPQRLTNEDRFKLLDNIREKGWRDATRGEDFRVLNDQLVKRAKGAISPERTAMREFGAWFDRALQGRVKTLLTVPNPQYHMTNLYGDLWNGYLADTSARSLAQSGRAMGRDVRRHAAKKTLTRVLDPTRRGVKIGGKRHTYDELLELAEKHGAIRTGFIGRDLPEVLDAMAKEGAEKVGQGRFARKLGRPGQRFAASRTGRTVGHPIDSIRAAAEYRENFVRFATFLQALKRGKSPAEAAAWAAKHHFDYGDLTDFERSVMRRIFPFYTFTARNTPLQVHRLATRPGKFATLEKARQEGAKAGGLEPGYEERLEAYERRGLPIPTPLKNADGSPLLLYPKLPATDLNRTALSLEEQAQLFGQMVSPFFKGPVEYGFNYNSFFREAIDPLYQKSGGKEHTLVSAPDFVRLLPAGMRKALKIEKGGDGQWRWPAKLDYLISQAGPAAGTAIQIDTPGKNRAGQSAGLRALAFGTGLRLAPFDRKRIELNELYDQRDRWDARAESLRKQGKARTKDGTETVEYRRVLDRVNALNRRLDGADPSRVARRAPARSSGWGAGSGWGGGGTKAPAAGSGWGPGANWGR